MNEQAALRKIFPRLAGGQNIAVVSTEDNEKTKLLKDIGNREIYEFRLPQPDNWVFSYVPGDAFSLDDTPADFWERVWSAFAQQSVGRFWQPLLEQTAERVRVRPIESDRVLRRLDRARVRQVLLLDDLDHFVDKPKLFTPELLGPLRSLSSRHPSFSIVFSSARRLRELNREVMMLGSPPFNNFNEILIEELKD
ncbi:MAG: hypothetical protein KDJ65_03980 [Anaerolineae bacterium]|nr:hypothetical protein [Anaerolineae bacterium]